jgi:hypothetical protein
MGAQDKPSQCYYLADASLEHQTAIRRLMVEVLRVDVVCQSSMLYSSQNVRLNSYPQPSVPNSRILEIRLFEIIEKGNRAIIVVTKPGT